MSVPQQPPYSSRRSVWEERKKQEFAIPYIMGSFEICDCVSCVAIGKWTEEPAIYHEVCKPFYACIKVVKVVVITVKQKNKNVGDIWQIASLIL